MVRIAIPGRDALTLAHLVSDLNGTLALDGVVLAGVAERLAQLGGHLAVHILTAGTHGGLARAQDQLARASAAAGVAAPHWERIATGADKQRYVLALGAEQVVALGNGTNDEPMLRVAALSIVVLGGEGTAGPALRAAHVVTASPLDALDLLLHPARLAATLRP
jgi:soluble P-type ATPase